MESKVGSMKEKKSVKCKEKGDESVCSLQCRRVKIGSYEVLPRPTKNYVPVLLKVHSLTFVAPLQSDPSKKVRISLESEDILNTGIHFGRCLRVMFISITQKFSELLRNALHMIENGTRNSDPFTRDDTSNLTLTFIMQCLTGDQMRFIQKKVLCKKCTNEIIELDQKTALKILENPVFELPDSFAVRAPCQPMEQEHTGEDITKNSDGKQDKCQPCHAPCQPMEQDHTGEDITKNSDEQSQKNNQKSDSCEVEKHENKILLAYSAPSANGRMNIIHKDFKRLNEGKFLNDAIINFYLKYFFDTVLTDYDQKRTHIFSSYFYDRLTQLPEGIPDTKINRYDRVKRWTKNIDLFSKDFIIFPINLKAHWILAVICHPSRVPDDPSKLHWTEHTAMEMTSNAKDPSQINCGSCEVGEQRNKMLPCICIFDSYKNYLEKEIIFKNLHEYIELELECKKGTKKVFNKITMAEFDVQCPQQSNQYDCGIYLLQFVESFFKKPIPYCDLEKDHSCWFSQETMKVKRQQLKTLILELQKEQEGASH